MTAVGKIFVFLNLLMSLAVGGLITLWFTVGPNYAAQNKQLKDTLAVADANQSTYYKEIQQAKADGKVELAQTAKDLEKAKGENEGLLAQIKALQKDLGEEVKKNQQNATLVKAAQSEATIRQSEVVQMKKTLGEERERNKTLIVQNSKLMEDAVTAKIDARTYKDANERITGELERLAKDNARLQANRGAVASTAPGAKNPPLDNVEGLIETTDPGGLVKITIGSDAGLTRGHTLEVFRTQPQPKYLGTIRILEVTAKEAVGQPVGRMTLPPQRGDRVASRIVVGS